MASMKSARAWLIWILSALFMFYKYALEVSPSVMTHHLMSAFNIDGAQLGNLAACYYYAYLIMQIPAGLLIDRFGPRRVTTISILVCAIGSVLFSLSDSFLLACFGRFLTGTGAAFAAINCLKLTKNWFSPRHFAFMAGLMMSLGMLGAVGGQAPLSHFISLTGWRHSLEIIGVVGFFLAILFWIVVRDRAPHHKEELVTSEKGSVWKHCMKIFKSAQAWHLSVFSGLAFAPVTVFGGLWGVPFLMEMYQIDHKEAAQLVSLIFIGFGVGAPLWGWLSDAIKSRRIVMGWGTVIAIVASIFVLYVDIPVWLQGVCLFGFGFFISGFLLCFTMISEITTAAVTATAIGFMNSFDALIGSLSDPLTGWFLDLGWDGRLAEGGSRLYSIGDYKVALFALPAYLVIAMVFFIFIKETYKKKEATPASLP